MQIMKKLLCKKINSLIQYKRKIKYCFSLHYTFPFNTICENNGFLPFVDLKFDFHIGLFMEIFV